MGAERLDVSHRLFPSSSQFQAYAGVYGIVTVERLIAVIPNIREP